MLSHNSDSPIEIDSEDPEHVLVELAKGGRMNALRAIARGVAQGRGMFHAKFVLLFGSVQPM